VPASATRFDQRVFHILTKLTKNMSKGFLKISHQHSLALRHAVRLGETDALEIWNLFRAVATSVGCEKDGIPS